ncbi:MAG TPA: hypothetical protein VF292_08580 [Rhodanobacteraceae bacterium]
MLSSFPFIVGQAINTTAGTNTFQRMVSGVCGFIQPLVEKSPVLSLMLVIGVIVFAFLAYFNENKEGTIIWLIRTALVFAVILNVFTFPSLIGLPSICT